MEIGLLVFAEPFSIVMLFTLVLWLADCAAQYMAGHGRCAAKG